MLNAGRPTVSRETGRQIQVFRNAGQMESETQ